MLRASLGPAVLAIAATVSVAAIGQTASRGAGVATSEATQPVASHEHWIEKDGIKIYLWEKYSGSPSGKSIVVLAHGSATAGKESFDLQVPSKDSYSLMDFLSREGFDVFALDTRGFGRSTHPDMHFTTQQASEDLDSAVDHVLKLRGAKRVNLLAWSWGTQYGGMFVMAHPEKVEKYVTYAQMHVESADIAKRRPRVDSFRKNPYITIPQAGWKGRFYSLTPAEASEPEVVDAYAKAAFDVEKKTPTSPQLDMVTILPMVNARLIPVPTLIIHGQYDDVADLDGLFPFFRQLPNPHKRYVVVPNAGHMMHLQKGHLVFQREVAGFFKTE
jgi:pimeloyl-ACP methyl ester carboxylesterase